MKKQLSVVAMLALLTIGASADQGDMYAGLENYGLSAKYDVTDKITAQAVVGVWGYNSLTAMTGRALYKFKKQDHLDFYGYGDITSWTWKDSYYGDETVIGFGAGAGAEYDIRGIDPDFIPLYLNLDLGLQVASFDHYGGFSGLGLGVGVHYKF